MKDGDSGMASSGNASGIRDFQLRLLDGMRNEAMVEDALRGLGADRADMAASRDRTEHVFLPAGCFQNAVALLGAPQMSETIDAPPPGSGSGRLTKLTYELPLWPDPVFCLQGVPESPIPDEIGFARPAHRPPAVPGGWEDLRPWAWLRGEVLERFGSPVDQGDNWYPNEEFKFQVRDASGNCRRFWAIFSWGLLQDIEWA